MNLPLLLLATSVAASTPLSEDDEASALPGETGQSEQLQLRAFEPVADQPCFGQTPCLHTTASERVASGLTLTLTLIDLTLPYPTLTL